MSREQGPAPPLGPGLALDTAIAGMQTRPMELRSLGRYRLVRRLPGSPSRCELFLAALEGEEEHPRHVAKLLMSGAADTEETRRALFEHEAKILRAINHPCVPTLHAYGQQEGVPYIVMDLVEGIDLARLLAHDTDEPRSLGKEVVVYIMGQLADALSHIHSMAELEEDESESPVDILHRDLCPANILLSVDGDVVLADFGSATSRWLEAKYDTPGAGHTAYKAPERVTGSGEATMATELFSLAVMMWEMFKGERCFHAENELKTMDAIVRFDISNSRNRVTGLSSKLSEVLRRNLDRDPERRYDSMFKMLQRLAQAPEAQAAETSRAELGALVRSALGER